jgi:peroxidase
MAATTKNIVRLLLAVQVAAVLLSAEHGVGAVSMDYYAMSCPFAEWVVRGVVTDAIRKDPTLAAALLRLHFHDCFVQARTYP